MNENTTEGTITAITALINGMGAFMTDLFQHIIPVIETWYQAMYKQYEQAGAPYGESHEGCLRWMEELAEVRRLEMEIERIVSHHAGLAYMRKRIAEKHAEGKMEDEDEHLHPQNPLPQS